MTNHRKILELSVNERLNVLKSHKKAVCAPISAGKNDKKKRLPVGVCLREVFMDATGSGLTPAWR